MYESERYLHVRIGTKMMWVKREREEEDDDPIVDDDDDKVMIPVTQQRKRLKKQPLSCIEIK